MSGVLTIRDVCALLKVSRGQFYKLRARLTAHGILQEALPRLDVSPRYLAGPVQAYTSGDRRAQDIKRQLRRVS